MRLTEVRFVIVESADFQSAGVDEINRFKFSTFISAEYLDGFLCGMFGDGVAQLFDEKDMYHLSGEDYFNGKHIIPVYITVEEQGE